MTDALMLSSSRAKLRTSPRSDLLTQRPSLGPTGLCVGGGQGERQTRQVADKQRFPGEDGMAVEELPQRGFKGNLSSRPWTSDEEVAVFSCWSELEMQAREEGTCYRPDRPITKETFLAHWLRTKEEAASSAGVDPFPARSAGAYYQRVNCLKKKWSWDGESINKQDLPPTRRKTQTKAEVQRVLVLGKNQSTLRAPRVEREPDPELPGTSASNGEHDTQEATGPGERGPAVKPTRGKGKPASRRSGETPRKQAPTVEKPTEPIDGVPDSGGDC